jgi:Ssu72-like protein
MMISSYTMHTICVAKAVVRCPSETCYYHKHLSAHCLHMRTVLCNRNLYSCYVMPSYTLCIVKYTIPYDNNSEVKLPGKSRDKPASFKFDKTSYLSMYDQLAKDDKEVCYLHHILYYIFIILLLHYSTLHLAAFAACARYMYITSVLADTANANA